ncbi:DUF3558 domain-containing protein [Kutzneria viridogrisea]|uniref:DUF3558 domain-containing protein n=1 Tax=Kutzneria viridogrisea TaxID=47990 RepID=UPI0031F85B4F
MACGGQVPGQPGPTTAAGGGSSASNAPTSTSATGSGPASLATLDPCKLLSPSEQQQLGQISSANGTNLAGVRGCDFTSTDFIVSPAILEKKGVADLVVTGTVSDIQVGSRSAREMRGDTGGCLVAIGVAAKSRVDVAVIDSRGNQDNACALAEKAAKLVEPKLPKS